MTADQIEVCVAAQAREGEANKAVRELLGRILGLPKSRVDILRGHKSRDKTVVVIGPHPDAGDEVEGYLDKMRSVLADAVD